MVITVLMKLIIWHMRVVIVSVVTQRYSLSESVPYRDTAVLLTIHAHAPRQVFVE